MPKKLKGTLGLWDFSTSLLWQNIKKLRGTFGEKRIRKKVSTPKKTEKGDTLRTLKVFTKSLTTPEKTERRTPLRFFNDTIKFCKLF